MKALYRLQLRLVATRARVLGLGALGLIGILLALTVQRADDPNAFAFSLIATFGLAGLVPVASLVLAAASLGDPAEDATLVHFWLRPVPRWHIAVASWLASLTLVVPLAVVPMAVAAAVCRVGAWFAVGAFVASFLGALAYTAVFVWFGLRVQRALAWGLAYVLIWEGAIATRGTGLARASIRGYTRSVLATFAPGDQTVRYSVSRPAALVALAIVSVAGMALAIARLHRTDVA